MTVAPAAISFIQFQILTTFSLVTSLSACLATRQTHSGIFNLQGQPSHFLEHNIGEGNRTKSNAVYHSGSDLEIKKIIKHLNFECHPSEHLNSERHSLLQTFVFSISSLQTVELRRHPFKAFIFRKSPNQIFKFRLLFFQTFEI